MSDRYACAELKGEIALHGDAERIHALRAELHETLEAFVRTTGAHPAQVAHSVFAPAGAARR